MKTTKKGFTLIELIVVIAIIGVLAAILVPSMLGYVRKSKISSANSTASSIFKAINSALTELDEEGFDVGGDVWIEITPLTGVCATNGANEFGSGTDDKLTGKIANFFSDIVKVKGGAIAYCTGGSCGAVSVAVDSTYVGTFPSGVVTSDTYETYKGKDMADEAMTEALKKNGITSPSGTMPTL